MFKECKLEDIQPRGCTKNKYKLIAFKKKWIIRLNWIRIFKWRERKIFKLKYFINNIFFRKS